MVPSSKPGGARREVVPVVALHRGQRDGAAGEPRPAQPGQRLPAGDQAAAPRRVAEELVEGDRDEVGADRRGVQGIGRREGGAVEQDVPAELVRLGDPLERVLGAAEVGLRRIREELRRRAVLPVALPAPRRAVRTCSSSSRRSCSRTGM